MSEMKIQFVDSDAVLKNRILNEWGEKSARHIHLEDGFSILAMKGSDIIGLISIRWNKLPSPLTETCEGYVDILEVHKDFRRMGIAAQLIDSSIERAKEKGVYQLRAWSSLDKTEAIPMWKALGFGLCPAITYPGGQEVMGYFVTKILSKEKPV